MNALVMYYSFSGKTKAIAEALANEESADIVEIMDVKPIGKLKAYTSGIVASIRGKSWDIKALDVNYDKYERLFLLAPVWAGNPPPAFNAMLNQLPKDKTVCIKMVSMSGNSSCCERLKDIIQCKGCNLESFEDIKS